MVMAQPETNETIVQGTPAAQAKEEVMAAEAAEATAATDSAVHADDDSSRLSQSTTDDNSLSRDSDSDHEEDEKASTSGTGTGGEESPTSVMAASVDEDIVPDGDSNADLHALLAFSKKRLDTVKPVEAAPAQAEAGTTEQDDINEEDEDDEKDDAEEEKKEEENDVVDAEADDAKVDTTTQDVSIDNSGTSNAAADQEDGVKKQDNEVKYKQEAAGNAADNTTKTEGLSAKEIQEMASKRDDNKELWALLSYSKQRLETGAHEGTKKKSSKSKKKKRASSIGAESAKSGGSSPQSAAASPTSSPARSPARRARGEGEGEGEGAEDMEDLDLDNENKNKNGEKRAGSNVEEDDDDDGERSHESVASEIFRSKEKDGLDDEEFGSDEEEEESSDDEEEDSDEDSDEDSEGGIPLTPSFLRQLEEEEEVDAAAAADAKIMSDAARSYADAILSVADEKKPGTLTDEQMLEAMYVAEAAAAAGEERFTTFGSLGRLHEAKASIKDLTASMKVEMEKAAGKAKAAKDRQQNKLFSGQRPAGQWIKGQLKQFQDTCAKVDQS